MEIAYGVVSRRSKPHPPLQIVRKLPKPIAESRNKIYKIFGNLPVTGSILPTSSIIPEIGGCSPGR
jgi:hypothetical protein